ATIFQTSFSENYNLIKDIYVQIEPFKNRRAGQLSGGMKQKLALCCALIHRPEVLFLDEPTTGVDAVSRKEFWDMLQGLKKQGISILVSTPYMDEANICDRVALLQKGKILSIDSPAGVIAHFKNPLVAVKAKQMLALLEKIKTLDFVQDAYPFGEFHHVVLQNEKAVPSLEQELEAADLGRITMHKVQANIEDCFIQLMKN
ncbi:MAG: ABC transporter ATP-binding protein, partial [Chitinophagaceae bacterium]|nr:ABC transporter ATP-binding protein [Chitinophagaceae bacterium]